MSDERAELSRRVGRAMLLPPEQSGLTVVRADGTRPVVLALPTDTLASVLRQVHELGGSANVVLPRAGNLLVLAVRGDGQHEGTDDVPVYPSTNMGMFLELVLHHGTVRSFLVEPDTAITADEPHPLLAPA